jgi:2',3'-cyclic-nucleotide 2'-phosphodiesterase/3'-nucleotidase
LSRNSKATSAKITETGPNTPIVYEVSNIEKSLSGSIPSPDQKQYQISLAIGTKTYETESEKDGSFIFPLEEQLRVGQILKVTASDTENGSIHYSRTVEVEVMNIDKYIVSKSTNLMLNEINAKSFFISGTCLDTGNVFIAIATGTGKSFQNTLLTLDTDSDGSFQYPIEDYLREGTKIYALSRFTDGEILLAAKTVVIAGAPDAPVLLKDVTNADKQVRVIANKDCEIVLKIGTKTYRSSEVIYDTKTKNYIYSIKIDRANSGAGITITAINSTGIGDETTSTVVMAAPDSPKINTVNAGDKVITGTMDYLDKETKAIAQIGNKTYEGTVDENGKYKITIPKQSAGSSILVWGTNKAGRGPMNKAIVVK